MIDANLLLRDKQLIVDQTIDKFFNEYPVAKENSISYKMLVCSLIDAYFYDISESSIDSSSHVIYYFLHSEEYTFLKNSRQHVIAIIISLTDTILSVSTCNELNLLVIKISSQLKELMQNNILQELKIWKIMAKILPISVLLTASISLLSFDNLFIRYETVIILFVIFSIMVGWWWWAVSKISKLILSCNRNAYNINTIYNTFHEISSAKQEHRNHTKK